MKAITIIQPFAELIAMESKRVENRTWATLHRGPIAIHAGKAQVFDKKPVKDVAEFHGVQADLLVFGAIIATATLDSCIKYEDAQKLPPLNRLYWVQKHYYATGPWCWVLTNVKRLEKPVFCNGAQGLWDWTMPAEGGGE